MSRNRAIWVSGATLLLLVAANAAAGPVVRPPPLRETGQVAEAFSPSRTIQIREGRNDHALPREQRIPKVTESDKPEPTVASGKIEPSLLARQIRSRFAALNGCPSEVARHKRIGLGTASAGKLTLRWTILPGGQVSETTVVIRSPANTHVMDCVKRQMSAWSFEPPDGGSMRIERPFSFRAR
jgi:hypothetical protein